MFDVSTLWFQDGGQAWWIGMNVGRTRRYLGGRGRNTGSTQWRGAVSTWQFARRQCHAYPKAVSPSGKLLWMFGQLQGIGAQMTANQFSFIPLVLPQQLVDFAEILAKLVEVATNCTAIFGFFSPLAHFLQTQVDFAVLL